MKPFRAIPKYRAKRTGGYASKREAQFAGYLKSLKDDPNSKVTHWIEQVPIKLSIGKLTIDFLVFNRDGTHDFYEVKGVQTRDFKLRMIALAKEHPEIYERLEVVS